MVPSADDSRTSARITYSKRDHLRDGPCLKVSHAAAVRRGLDPWIDEPTARVGWLTGQCATTTTTTTTTDDDDDVDATHGDAGRRDDGDTGEDDDDDEDGV